MRHKNRVPARLTSLLLTAVLLLGLLPAFPIIARAEGGQSLGEALETGTYRTRFNYKKFGSNYPGVDVRDSTGTTGKRSAATGRTKSAYSSADFEAQLSVRNRRSNSLPMRPLPWRSPVDFAVQSV